MLFSPHPFLVVWCRLVAGVCRVANCTTQRSDFHGSDLPTMPPGLAPGAANAALVQREDGQTAGPPAQASRENGEPLPPHPLHPTTPCLRTLRTTLSRLPPATRHTASVCQEQGETDQEKSKSCLCVCLGEPMAKRGSRHTLGRVCAWTRGSTQMRTPVVASPVSTQRHTLGNGVKAPAGEENFGSGHDTAGRRRPDTPLEGQKKWV